MNDILSCLSRQVADADDDDVRAACHSCRAGAQPVAVSPVHLRPPVISALPRRRNMHMHACSRDFAHAGAVERSADSLEPSEFRSGCAKLGQTVKAKSTDVVDYWEVEYTQCNQTWAAA